MKDIGMRLAACVVLFGAMVGTGCKQNAPAPAPVVNGSGSAMVPGQAAANGGAQGVAVRNPDGSITNPDGSVTYPAGSRVATRENAPNGPPPAPGAGPVVRSVEAPRGLEAPRVGPVNEAAVPVVRTVPSGTAVVVRLNGGLAASRNEVGDRFSGVLERPLTNRGETVFAAGTPVSGEVVASKGKGRFKGAGDLGIELTAIGRDRVATTEYEVFAKGRGKRTAGFTGGGAGLGALIGGLAGGGKGALIGGLAGAGGGAAASAYTGNRDVVIRSESVITFRLRESLTR